MKHTVHRQVLREGQYEIWYSVFYDDGTLIIGGLTHRVGKKMLDKAEADKLFDTVIYPQITEMLNPPPDDKSMKESEIVAELVKKGYLEEGDKFEDLPDKSSLEAK